MHSPPTKSTSKAFGITSAQGVAQFSGELDLLALYPEACPDWKGVKLRAASSAYTARSGSLLFIARANLYWQEITFTSHSKMNWTGGRLSRHSRKAGSSTTSKQKQHFAKVRSHLMSGSVKNGPAKRPNFGMAAPQPHDELSFRDGSVRTKLQQPIDPFSHDLRVSHSLYGEIKRPRSEETSRREQPGHMDSRSAAQSSIHSCETKLKPISTIEPVHGDYEVQDNMEAIRRKRFRILREGDWLGLSIQRPLQLKYMEPESRDAIGKRRKLSSGYEAQYLRAQDKNASPFAPNRHAQKRDIFPKPGHNPPQLIQYGQAPSAKGSVRIFIGGRERHVRESSGSVVNRPQFEYVQSSSSSDVMLLDLERGGSRPRLPHQPSSDMVNGNGCIPEPVKYGRQASEDKSISSFGDYPSSGPRIHQIQGVTGNMHAPSLPQQNSPILPLDCTKPNWQGASPVIYHPTPKSSTTSRLLRHNSSLSEGSVAATAGRKGTVAASVAQDEEMWRSWLLPESDDEKSSVWHVDGQSDELSLDGNSTSRDTTQSILHRLSSTDQNDRDDESGHGRELIPSIPNHISSATRPPDGENSGNHNKAPSLRMTGTSRPHGPASDDIQLSTNIQNEKPREKSRDAAWEAFVLVEPSKNLVGSIVEPQKRVIQEDPGAEWKKFVLSSDSDDENTTFGTDDDERSKTSASQKRMQSSSSMISLHVNPAETVIHSEPMLDNSSEIASTGLAPSRSNNSEANGKVSETSIYFNGSSCEVGKTPSWFARAGGKPSERIVSEQRKWEDPLARYMPRPLHSGRDIVMAKEVQLPEASESFERGLDDSLKGALQLGRRYAKQEMERHAKQDRDRYTNHEEDSYTKKTNERFVERNKRRSVRGAKESMDIYDIPISDDTEEAEEADDE
ncbi:hypothetical protein V497_05445 [Pseudogymnoascus sp. VKM F-4516 (FW-969)]|nr:hypothetical protein V497_05445 [Pseudogymnoascus sp. VKM F-4516 (FW-969)]